MPSPLPWSESPGVSQSPCQSCSMSKGLGQDRGRPVSVQERALRWDQLRFEPPCQGDSELFALCSSPCATSQGPGVSRQPGSTAGAHPGVYVAL